MPGLDVFNSDAFRMQTLTKALLDRAHRPLRLGEMGLFQSEGVRTTTVSIERQGNTIQLVQTSPRGGPAPKNAKDGRTLKSFETVRIAIDDEITADEVQNVRAFGSETDVDTYQAEVARRADRMSASIAVTEEFQRIGALKGLILDADSSTLLDLNTAFGTGGAQTEVDFAMDAGDSPTERSLTDKISGIIRTIEDELDGLPYTGIHAMCSSQFFDDLLGHPGFRATFLGWPDAAKLRERTARNGRMVSFGGVDFEEYRGKIGSTSYVADNKAHFFPLGVPDLFITRYAPAEYIETVGTEGLPRYVIINPDGTDPKHKRTVRVQSQAIHLMTRPKAQVLAKRT